MRKRGSKRRREPIPVPKGGRKPTTLKHKFESFPEAWPIEYEQNSGVRAEYVYEDFNHAQQDEIKAWLLDAETEKGRENAISPEEWGAYFGIYSKTARRLMDVVVPFPDGKARKRKMDFGARPKPWRPMDALAAAAVASTEEDMGNAKSSSGNCCCKSLRDDELGFDEVALHALQVPRRSAELATTTAAALRLSPLSCRSPAGWRWLGTSLQVQYTI